MEKFTCVYSSKDREVNQQGGGEFIAYFYKSSLPEAFEDINTTLLKLQLLGYTTEYGKINIEHDSEAIGITTDIKLTIKW